MGKVIEVCLVCGGETKHRSKVVKGMDRRPVDGCRKCIKTIEGGNSDAKVRGDSHYTRASNKR